jgi:hypothetical protein
MSKRVTSVGCPYQLACFAFGEIYTSFVMVSRATTMAWCKGWLDGSRSTQTEEKLQIVVFIGCIHRQFPINETAPSYSRKRNRRPWPEVQKIRTYPRKNNVKTTFCLFLLWSEYSVGRCKWGDDPSNVYGWLVWGPKVGPLFETLASAWISGWRVVEDAVPDVKLVL